MLDLAPDIGGMRCLSRNATRKPTASDVDRTIRQNGYGVVRVGSRQYKVSQGDLIFCRESFTPQGSRQST